jgi:hypothetical protein
MRDLPFHIYTVVVCLATAYLIFVGISRLLP